HNIQLFPIQATADAKKTGWKPIIPGGFGFQIPMTKSIRIEFLGGYTYTYRDDLDGTILTKGNDGFYHWTIGITFGSYIKPRPSKAKPKRVPVPESPDDDKDGLTDRDELNIYHTNPDQSDTDKDGLTDYEEVRLYFTNPNVLDSDADGLIDSEEILSYKTDPHIADTDSDGLTDGQEVITHLTDPLKADTDGDGMSDGDEIIKGRDPLEKE
ncbi:MAG: OmpA family protein, partial [Candidatus Latescibacteria bacterium]|nr:OmpA family protein [Candidatus Latescibacterota bacterium]